MTHVTTPHDDNVVITVEIDEFYANRILMNGESSHKSSAYTLLRASVVVTKRAQEGRIPPDWICRNHNIPTVDHQPPVDHKRGVEELPLHCRGCTRLLQYHLGSNYHKL